MLSLLCPKDVMRGPLNRGSYSYWFYGDNARRKCWCRGGKNTNHLLHGSWSSFTSTSLNLNAPICPVSATHSPISPVETCLSLWPGTVPKRTLFLSAPRALSSLISVRRPCRVAIMGPVGLLLGRGMWLLRACVNEDGRERPARWISMNVRKDLLDLVIMEPCARTCQVFSR